MTRTDPVAPPTPPTTGYENAPPPSVDDPTAQGFYCGSRRSDQQIRQATEQGDTPWPWCRLRAGWGTDHAGFGRCKLHAGNTPGGKRAAQLKLEELRNPAIVALAKVLTDVNATAQAKLRAVENVLDRTGHPRRLDVDMDAARENLVERIQAAMEAPEAEN